MPKILYSNNALVISRGIITGNNEKGVTTLKFYTPMTYTRTLYCFAGDLVTYLLCYTCNDCSIFGEENVGSEWGKFCKTPD
jgi:hypothetical protein